MIDLLHIAVDGTVTRGDAAAPLLARDNRDLVGPDGVLFVDKQRWALAQQYERDTWLVRGLQSWDDRGEEHAERFGGYETISGWTFGDACEVGCGPFTQHRRMPITVRSVELCDPLAERYELHHPHCHYRALRSYEREWMRVRSVSLEQMIGRTYDLVVCINVLEHVYDYRQAIEQLRGLLAPGSGLVISESGIGREHLDEVLSRTWDAGHPIRIAEDRLVRDIEAIGCVLFHRVYDSHVAWKRDHYYIVQVPRG